MQAVGMRCRECLIAFVRSVAEPDMVPAGQDPPKAADVIHWTELIADTVSPGPRAADIRGYLKALGEIDVAVGVLAHPRRQRGPIRRNAGGRCHLRCAQRLRRGDFAARATNVRPVFSLWLGTNSGCRRSQLRVRMGDRMRKLRFRARRQPGNHKLATRTRNARDASTRSIDRDRYTGGDRGCKGRSSMLAVNDPHRHFSALGVIPRVDVTATSRANAPLNKPESALRSLGGGVRVCL